MQVPRMLMQITTSSLISAKPKREGVSREDLLRYDRGAERVMGKWDAPAAPRTAGGNAGSGAAGGSGGGTGTGARGKRQGHAQARPAGGSAGGSAGSGARAGGGTGGC